MGIALGFVTTALLLPQKFTTAQIGILTLLVSYSSLFATFGNLGTQSMIIRIFPFFRSESSNKHHGFLGLANTIGFIGFLLSLVVLFLLKPWIIENSQNSTEVEKYLHYLPILIFFTLFFFNFDAYSRALLRSVSGVFLKDFLQRVFILTSIVIFLFKPDFDYFIKMYVLSLCLPTFLFLIDLIWRGDFNLIPDFAFLNKQRINKVIDTSLFGILFGFGNVIVQRLDIIMISWFESLSLTGIYNISLFFGSIVSSPARALQRISTGIISDAFKVNDLKTIESVYKKTSLNQFIVAAIVFLGIIINLDNVYRILPEEYTQGRMVIIFYGLSAVTNMVFGQASSIIGISPFYRFQTWFMGLFAIMIIITNLIFIPMYGISGAAFASFLSTIAYCLLMYFFLLKKYGLRPFNYKYLIVAFIIGILYLLNSVLPTLKSLYIDIFYRSILISFLYLFLLLIFKLSEDISRVFFGIVFQIKKRL